MVMACQFDHSGGCTGSRLDQAGNLLLVWGCWTSSRLLGEVSDSMAGSAASTAHCWQYEMLPRCRVQGFLVFQVAGKAKNLRKLNFKTVIKSTAGAALPGYLR